MAKSKAVGTAKLAGEFFDAAAVVGTGASDPSRPALFLYCHAIELLLKAALIAAGASEADLKRLGHDLSATLRRVRRHPGALRIKLSRKHQFLVGHLNRLYEVKDFEYLFTGFKRYPLMADVQLLAAELIPIGAQIEQQVRQASRAGSGC